MSTFSSVGVNNDLASRQTRITVRSANDKLTRRVDVVFDVVAKETEYLLGVNLRLYTGNQDVNDILTYLMKHSLVIRVKLIMLGGNHDGINALRNAVVAVLHRHLTLGVRAEVGHQLAFLADLSQRLHDEMCQVERYRHQALRLVRGVAKHHPLVTGTLFLLVTIVHTTVDVNALFMNGSQDTAGIAVKLVFSLRIANLFDGFAGNGLQVDVYVTANFSHNDDLSSGDK